LLAYRARPAGDPRTGPVRLYTRRMLESATVGPHGWEAALGATDLGSLPEDPRRPFHLGIYRFGELPERVTAPAVDHHYISFTMRGRLAVARELGGGVERGTLRTGLSLIMAAGQTNIWSWDGPTDELHLWISPAFLADVALEAGMGAPTVIERFPFEDPPLRSMALAVYGELRSPARAGALFDDLAAHSLALQILRRHCSSRPADRAGGALTPRQLRRVTDRMLAELGRDLALADLARLAGVSRSHFSRAFREATGRPPYRWLTERRVERAKHLLATTTLTVAEVGAEVGYPNPSHFAEVFGRHAGSAPREYRRLTQG
jgi:AraC family transcriptional regulator